jgi:hypothetical protein
MPRQSGLRLNQTFCTKLLTCGASFCLRTSIKRGNHIAKTWWPRFLERAFFSAAAPPNARKGDMT